MELRTENISSPMGIGFFCADAMAREEAAVARKVRRFMSTSNTRNSITNVTLVSVLPQFPADSLIEPLLAHLRVGRNAIIEAAPGAGKTTRIPPALLALGGE